MRQQQGTQSLIYKLRSLSSTVYNTHSHFVAQCDFMLRKNLQSWLKQTNTELENLIKTVANMHPQNVLKRGYTITRLNGKAVTSLHQVNAADILQTLFQDGSVESEVKTIKESSGL